MGLIFVSRLLKTVAQFLAAFATPIRRVHHQVCVLLARTLAIAHGVFTALSTNSLGQRSGVEPAHLMMLAFYIASADASPTEN